MREQVSGMSIEEYQNWMLHNLDDLRLRNDGRDVDGIVASMQDDDIDFSSVNPAEYEGILG